MESIVPRAPCFRPPPFRRRLPCGSNTPRLPTCDLDHSCTAWSRFALGQCAFLGRCAAGRYEDALATLEPPELMAHAQVLRTGILRALRDHDWDWLGLP